MTQEILDRAHQLRELNVPREAIGETRDILATVPEVADSLADPTVSLVRRHAIIDKIFPEAIRDFLKLLCDREEMALLAEIFDAYEEETPVQTEALRATLAYVTPPTPAQIEGIRSFLAKTMNALQVELELREDPSLGNGFKLKVGHREFDWSAAGRVEQLKQRISAAVTGTQQSTAGIISILRAEIGAFELEAEGKEIGTVTFIGDGIARIDGLDHAMYGEVVLFDNGVKGMVRDIRRHSIGVILFGREGDIREGSRVVRTGKMAGIPVGEGFLGRVVDALGAPIDGGDAIQEEGYRPIEHPAPGIVDRKSVGVPLETGVLAIDSMFPIGRGQRELIIGDRQTGKTSLALDAILNQKGKNVICVYVAIGQKASTVAKVVSTLKAHEALPYTVVVSATASDPAPLQYIAPYAGTALAEYFMYNGRDVLIVYDDLSKHAVAYRALSLLLESPPGREAYPGDVFYLHSRLLERSSRLTPELSGGSLTALPIIETQAGDVSAYIPTNVISITDGQIFLESSLFFSGQRPAVNVGLSVSRVGGAAQTKAMKKAAGSIRIDLAQYREMEVFTQFSSDLDDTTRAQLDYGKGLMELLKQPTGQPLSMAQQVVLLVAATARVMLPVPAERIRAFREGLLAAMEQEHAEIMQELTTQKTLTPELSEAITQAATAYAQEFLAQ